LERAGLFKKVRHGGYFNRNSYEPNWTRLAAIDDEWKAKLSRRSRESVTSLSPAAGRSCHLNGDSPVTQTYKKKNLPKETCSNGTLEKGKEAKHYIKCGLTLMASKSSTNAAHDDAERRWTTAVHHMFVDRPVTYGQIIGAVDDEIRSAATAAELSRRGAGLAFILIRLKLGDGR